MQIFLLTHNPERSHRREMKKHKGSLCLYWVYWWHPVSIVMYSTCSKTNGAGLWSERNVNCVLNIPKWRTLRILLISEVFVCAVRIVFFSTFHSSNSQLGPHRLWMAFFWPLRLQPAGNCAEPALPGRGALVSPQTPLSPLEPKVLLGIQHTIFKQSLTLIVQRSLPLCLYSEAVANPSQCCFNSCYCCFSIDGVPCLLSLKSCVLFMGHGSASQGRRLL